MSRGPDAIASINCVADDLATCAAGPDRLTCTCGDGSQLAFCDDLDCASAPAIDALCDPACADHGGLDATGCIDDDGRSAP